MTGELPFVLTPFEADPRLTTLSLSGGIARCGDRLAIRYRLQGPLHTVAIPAPAASPMRLDDLWQSTCFECFVAAAGAAPYWEFNLSPAGHWNLYRLAGYRDGLEPEPTLAVLPFRVQRHADELALELACGLPQGLAIAPALELAVTAVIQLQDGSLSHWALAHPGPGPDFHRRDGFRLRL